MHIKGCKKKARAELLHISHASTRSDEGKIEGFANSVAVKLDEVESKTLLSKIVGVAHMVPQKKNQERQEEDPRNEWNLDGRLKCISIFRFFSGFFLKCR